MFSKLFIVLASVAVLATATPNTAQTECCDQVGSATEEPFSSILAGLGINVQDITALVGLDCSPITVSSLQLVLSFPCVQSGLMHYTQVVGVGSSGSCNTNTVSCTNNNVVSHLPYQYVVLGLTRESSLRRVGLSLWAASPSPSKARR